MNRQLDKLHAYPFARLRALLANVAPNPQKLEIALTIGEPQMPAPEFVQQALIENLSTINRYPLALGLPELRQAIASWLVQRYRLEQSSVCPDRHILPLQGSREGLFAIAQTVVDASSETAPLVLLPSPFYQIYEGAALLAGAEPLYIPCESSNGFAMDFSTVTEAQWQRCQLVYLCSPSNPTGYVASREDYERLLALADQYDFVIVSDECYSEIYPDESAPVTGLLQVCHEMGRGDFSRCLVFNSLSKRSNLAGMRSGFVAGDEVLIKQFLQYRTYHGSAMPLHHQYASIAAWQDESHVVANREVYRRNFDVVLKEFSRLPASQQLSLQQPQGGFCLWLPVSMDDAEFAVQLYQQASIKVLPGSFLAREGVGTANPGVGYVRLALVHDVDVCREAAQRITQFMQC